MADAKASLSAAGLLEKSTATEHATSYAPASVSTHTRLRRYRRPSGGAAAPGAGYDLRWDSPKVDSRCLLVSKSVAAKVNTLRYEGAHMLKPVSKAAHRNGGTGSLKAVSKAALRNGETVLTSPVIVIDDDAANSAVDVDISTSADVRKRRASVGNQVSKRAVAIAKSSARSPGQTTGVTGYFFEKLVRTQQQQNRGFS